MTTRDTPWPPGTPCWDDLSTTDADDARAFFAELFAWEYNLSGPEAGNYATATLRGQEVVGIQPQQNPSQPIGWTTYLATEDINKTVDLASQAGGSVLLPPMEVMGLGHLAVVADPTGGAFGLWQAGSHIGSRVANETGTPIWNELMTHDLETAKQFYAAVFGYTYQDADSLGAPYAMFEVDGNVAGGLGQMSSDDVAAHWRLYFAVDDADAAVDQIVKLGGSVLRPAQDMPFGRWAEVADRQGATFSVVAPPPQQG